MKSFMSKKQTLTINKNVPIPPIRTGLTHTLRAMDVGDSFVVPVKKRVNVVAVARQADITIITRAEGQKLVRVWKTGSFDCRKTGVITHDVSV